MIDKSSLLKSQGSLYLEFIPKDGLFPKMLLLSLMGFLTGWCNLEECIYNRFGCLVEPVNIKFIYFNCNILLNLIYIKNMESTKPHVKINVFLFPCS